MRDFEALRADSGRQPELAGAFRRELLSDVPEVIGCIVALRDAFLRPGGAIFQRLVANPQGLPVGLGLAPLGFETGKLGPATRRRRDVKGRIGKAPGEHGEGQAETGEDAGGRSFRNDG